MISGEKVSEIIHNVKKNALTLIKVIKQYPKISMILILRYLNNINIKSINFKYLIKVAFIKMILIHIQILHHFNYILIIVVIRNLKKKNEYGNHFNAKLET
jgi:hypothetical protein